jgi:hypothetical protein
MERAHTLTEEEITVIASQERHHGWAMVRELAPKPEVHRILTINSRLPGQHRQAKVHIIHTPGAATNMHGLPYVYAR